MQLQRLQDRLTPAQMARRNKRIAKRAAARGDQPRPTVALATKTAPRRRQPFRELRAAHKAAQDRVADFLTRRLAAIGRTIGRDAFVLRCPFERYAGAAACGGRLKLNTQGVLVCRACGRDWIKGLENGRRYLSRA